MPRTATSTTDSMTVATAIREARRTRGLTQAALAARLGVSAAFVNKLEAGRTNATVGTLARVAAALDAELSVRLVLRSPVAGPSAAEMLRPA